MEHEYIDIKILVTLDKLSFGILYNRSDKKTLEQVFDAVYQDDPKITKAMFENGIERLKSPSLGVAPKIIIDNVPPYKRSDPSSVYIHLTDEGKATILKDNRKAPSRYSRQLRR